MNLSPDPALGYLFGNFSINSLTSRLSVQFVYRNLNDSNKEILVPFLDGHGAVHPIPVEPGTYKLASEMLMGYGPTSHRIRLDLDSNDSVFAPFAVPANTLVYLGRSHATSSYSVDLGTPVRKIRVPEIQYDLEADRRLLMLFYPAFNGMTIRRTTK